MGSTGRRNAALGGLQRVGIVQWEDSLLDTYYHENGVDVGTLVCTLDVAVEDELTLTLTCEEFISANLIWTSLPAPLLPLSFKIMLTVASRKILPSRKDQGRMFRQFATRELGRRDSCPLLQLKAPCILQGHTLFDKSWGILRKKVREILTAGRHSSPPGPPSSKCAWVPSERFIFFGLLLGVNAVQRESRSGVALSQAQTKDASG